MRSIPSPSTIAKKRSLSLPTLVPRLSPGSLLQKTKGISTSRSSRALRRQTSWRSSLAISSFPLENHPS